MSAQPAQLRLEPLTDILSPPRPVPPYFDPASDAWVLSRYRDVLAAFREPNLWTVGSSGEGQMEVRDEIGKLRARGEMQEELSSSKVSEWQSRMETLAASAVAQLPAGRPVDLLREFALPWCLSLAIIATRVDPDDRPRLADLGASVFSGTGEPKGSELHAQASAATAELDRYFQQRAMRNGEPTFIAISQTMARLLSNGWLVLFRHPAEAARLRAQPDLIPGAVDELLRYAGIIPKLFRRAIADVDLGGLRIAKEQRVNLMVASANRDPEQFPDPDRFDVTRRVANHLALGIGRNSCIGAFVIRMAAAVTAAALLKEFPAAEPAGSVEWVSGAGFCFPGSVQVLLRRASMC